MSKVALDNMLVETKLKKTVKPMPVPTEDNQWRDFFFIDQYNIKYWWYKNAKGEKLFIVKRVPDKNNPLKKSFQQGSYGSGKYHKENLWTKLHGYKLPLYRLDELVKNDKETILIVEGEDTCEKAQLLLPDMFVTTYASGAKNFPKSDWSVLKGKNVVAWPDIEDTNYGRKSFESLCLFLKDEYDISAKVVNVPSYTELQRMFAGNWEKNGWDLADTIPEEINVQELIDTAEEPEPVEDVPFSNIEDYRDNYIYIRNLGNRYWDKQKRKITTQEEINNLFLRAKGRGSFTSGKAHEWFHRNNIPFVDGTTFYPSDKEIIERRDQKLINLYTPPKFESLGEVPGIEDKVSWFVNHVKYLCSYDEESTQILLNVFAAALQRPYENRTWAPLICSGQGNGKGIYFEAIAKCVGWSNCSFLKLQQLYSKFNSFLTRANNLFVREANNRGSEDNQSIATLKELITENIHEVEFKGKDFLQHECHYNIYLSTNESNPIKVSRDDRRICFIVCELQPKGRDYYTDIYENKLANNDRIKELYYYFRYVHKIPEEFNLKYAPTTIWKDQLIEDSMTSYEYEVNKLIEEKTIESFYWDLVNVDKVYNDLSYWRVEDSRSYKNPFQDKPITKMQIKNCIKKLGGFKYRHYAIPQLSDIHERGNYWVIRNFDKWREARDNLQAVRDHFNDPLLNLRKQKDIKKNASPFGDGYSSHVEMNKDQLRFDNLIQAATNTQKQKETYDKK